MSIVLKISLVDLIVHIREAKVKQSDACYGKLQVNRLVTNRHGASMQYLKERGRLVNHRRTTHMHV